MGVEVKDDEVQKSTQGKHETLRFDRILVMETRISVFVSRRVFVLGLMLSIALLSSCESDPATKSVMDSRSLILGWWLDPEQEFSVRYFGDDQSTYEVFGQASNEKWSLDCRERGQMWEFLEIQGYPNTLRIHNGAGGSVSYQIQFEEDESGNALIVGTKPWLDPASVYFKYIRIDPPEDDIILYESICKKGCGDDKLSEKWWGNASEDYMFFGSDCLLHSLDVYGDDQLDCRERTYVATADKFIVYESGSLDGIVFNYKVEPGPGMEKHLVFWEEGENPGGSVETYTDQVTRSEGALNYARTKCELPHPCEEVSAPEDLLGWRQPSTGTEVGKGRRAT